MYIHDSRHKKKSGLWPCKSTHVAAFAIPLSERSLQVYFPHTSGTILSKMRDNCPCLYSQWKRLGALSLCGVIFPSLSTEHRSDVPYHHCMRMTDNPFRDEDTLQSRVTCLPRSAVILGLTLVVTNSVDKNTDIIMRYDYYTVIILWTFKLSLLHSTNHFKVSFCDIFVTNISFKHLSLN